MNKTVYTFLMPDAQPCEHEVLLDERGASVNEGGGVEDAPAWAKLDFRKCPNCPLQSSDTPLCPVAKRLPPLMEIANHVQSYDRIVVEVKTGNRQVREETTAQRALSSLLGLIMASSGCPHTEYLRPMARFHLPLADEEETVYRATSMYLLSQYFLNRHQQPADLSLNGLITLYHELQAVNVALADRIRAASQKDTAANAIVLLDLFAKGIPYVIEDSLEELRPLFSAYFNEIDAA